MTLSSFKNRSKLTIAVGFLIAYGLVSYTIGLSVQTGYLTKIKDHLIFNPQPSKSKSTLATPVDPLLPSSDEQSGTVIGSYVKLCANTEYSFEISYPKDWFTTYDNQKDKCTYFAPYSFTVLTDPGANIVPIKIEVVEPEKWESTVKFYENPNDFQNVISSQNIAVNGRSIQKIKAQTTGQESLERGLIKISYLVFNSRLPLVFTYQQLDQKDNVEEFDKNLEDMVSSLNYF